jgi:glycosyltransferase involved in cell wall biosynthesis
MTATKPGGIPPPYSGTRIDRIGVVVPVNNEQDTLLQCLDALSLAVARVTIPVTVIIVLDACTDDSASVAAEFSTAGMETIAVDAHCVGSARAAGVSEILRRHGESGTWLATTDADSAVPQNWLTAQQRHAEAGARVVAGTVRVEDWADRSSTVAAKVRRDYRAVSHRHIHGANLSFAASAYRAAGGFQSVTCNEDVLLVDAFEANGEPIAWAVDLAVATSARRRARAPMGFANYLTLLEDSHERFGG